MTSITTNPLAVTLTPEQARAVTVNGPDRDGGWCIDCHINAPAIATEPDGDTRLCPSCALTWTTRADFGTGAWPEMDAEIVAGLNRLAVRQVLRQVRSDWSGRPSIDDPRIPHTGWVGCDADDARYGWDADW